MKQFSSRFIGLSLLFCLILFCIFITLAFSNYPGGNNFDPLAHGHSFWKNFWCDVMAEQTVNQVANTARPFGIIAAFFLISGLLITGINSYRLITISKNKYRLMLGLGVLSIVVSPGVNYYHDPFLIVSAVSGMSAFLMFLYYSFQTPHKLFSVLGLLALLTGTINFIMWLQEHQTIALPIIQKISTIFLFFWMLAGSLILLKNKPALDKESGT